MTCEISDVECINCEEPHCLKDAVGSQIEYKNMKVKHKNLQRRLKELCEEIEKNKHAIIDYYKDNKEKINDHRTWMY